MRLFEPMPSHPGTETGGRKIGSMLKPTYLAPGERELLRRFWKAASGFWKGGRAWKAWLVSAALIATVLLQLLTQYKINFWNRDFFDAVGRRELVAGDEAVLADGRCGGHVAGAKAH